MFKPFLFCCTLVIVFVMACNEFAYGWAGVTHGYLCQKTFDDPVVSPLLSTISNPVTISMYTGEPPGNWHDQQWNDIVDRAYVQNAGSPNGNNWWSLDETTRLKYLHHNTTDVGVPIGHHPASLDPGGFADTGKEAYLELQVSQWGTYPSVAGTCNFTNNKTGHSYNFTGTIDEVVDTFYDACRDNMEWSKSHLAGFPYVHDYQDYRAAGWNGTTIALMLQRAVFVDYFLSKLDTVADIDDGRFVLSPGDSTRFDGRECYDPDAITWHCDGTYSQTYAPLKEYCWDFNDDGVWDLVDHDPYVDRTYEQLIAIGVPTDTWVNYRLRVEDDEQHYAYEEDWLWLSSGGGVPEPATMSLLGIGAIGILLNKRRK